LIDEVIDEGDHDEQIEQIDVMRSIPLAILPPPLPHAKRFPTRAGPFVVNLEMKRGGV
jgi:hypothetical protein